MYATPLGAEKAKVRPVPQSAPPVRFESAAALTKRAERMPCYTVCREEMGEVERTRAHWTAEEEERSKSFLQRLRLGMNNPFAQSNFETPLDNPGLRTSDEGEIKGIHVVLEKVEQELEPMHDPSIPVLPLKERMANVGQLGLEGELAVPGEPNAYDKQKQKHGSNAEIDNASANSQEARQPDAIYHDSPLMAERKYKSLEPLPLPLPLQLRNLPRNKQEIKVVYDERIRLAKLIDPSDSIRTVIAALRTTLEAKGYLYKNVKNPLVLKDENNFELDEEDSIGSYMVSRTVFKLGFRKFGPEYTLTAEGSFDLLDVPDKVIDMHTERGEYQFRVAWKKRKNGIQPLPSLVSEKELMCHNPAFLFDFFATFTKKLIK